MKHIFTLILTTAFAMNVWGFTITFDANGGTVEQETYTTDNNGKLASLPTSTRDNYTFEGWFTEEAGDTQISTNTVFSTDTTVYAKWTLITYIVSFSLNSGSGTIPANIASVVRGSTLSTEQMPSTAGFTRSGYVNDGKWYTSTAGTTEFVFGSNGTAVTANITLYLKWNPTYTVSFNLNGGSGTAPASIIVVQSSTLSTEQMPSTAGFTRSGYVNDGKWYTGTGGTETRTIIVSMSDSYGDGWNGAALRISVNGTNLSTNPTISGGSSNSYSFNVNSGDVVAFYWIKGSYDGECSFTVYYSGNSSTTLLSRSGSSLSSISTGTSLGSFTVPSPTYTEFLFGDGGTAVTANTTLYLKWNPTYTVSFNLNEGSGTAPASITGILYGNKLSTEQMPSAARFTRSGYVNDGKWYTSTAGTTEFVFGSSGTTVTANTTLYLKWIPIYTVTFNANGGTVTTSIDTTRLDGKLASLPTPTRDNYIFEGWFTSATGSTAVTTSTVFSTNTTIYARWITITPSSLSNATKGVSYSRSLSLDNSTYVSSITWSIDGGALPTGLTINSATGTISGTPSVAGIFNFTVKADIGASSGTKNFSIRVGNSYSEVPSPVIVTSNLPSSVQGIDYNRSLALEEVGMPVKWSIGSGTLPAGLKIDSTTGVISGIPTSVGTFYFTVMAHNGETSGSKSLSIQVVSANSVFEQLSIPTIIVAREPLALSSMVMHNTTQALTWRVLNAGTTGATISNNTLNTTASGTVTITVSIGENNERSFTIMVLPVGTLAISNSYSPLAASNSPTYYNLRGIPLGSKKPATPGVYIEKRGYVSKKVVVP